MLNENFPKGSGYYGTKQNVLQNDGRTDGQRERLIDGQTFEGFFYNSLYASRRWIKISSTFVSVYRVRVSCQFEKRRKNMRIHYYDILTLYYDISL